MICGCEKVSTKPDFSNWPQTVLGEDANSVSDAVFTGSLIVDSASNNLFWAGFLLSKIEITFNPLAVIFTNWTCLGLYNFKNELGTAAFNTWPRGVI